MSARKTFLAAIVFLALLALYLVDVHRLERQQAREARSERLFSFEVSSIQSVVLHNGNGDFRIERRGANDWWLTQPLETKADNDQVDPMLRNLQGAKKRNSFTPTGDLAQYGLKDPAVWVELTGAEDGKTQTVKVLFGDTAAQTYQVYGQIAGEKDIFTMSDYSKRQCEKTLLNLRDKTLLAAAPESVTRLRIDENGGTVEVVRPSTTDNAWTLDPSAAAADSETIDNLLRTLQNTRATQILDSPSTPSVEFGTTPNRSRATVFVWNAPAAGGKSEATKAASASTSETAQVLYIGKSRGAETGEVYAQLKGDPRVFVVRDSILTDLDKKPADLRDKRLLDVTRTDLASILIRSSSQSVEIHRSSRDADWSFADGAQPPVSQKKADQLAADLPSLKATKFLGDARESSPEQLKKWGLETPEVEVRVHTFDNPTTGGFDRGAVDVDQGLVYIRRLSDGAALGLDFKRVGDFSKFREDLEDRSFVHFDPEAVEQMRIEAKSSQGLLAYEFTRRKSSWTANTAAGRRVTIQPYDVTSFLGDIVELEYAKPYTPPSDDETRGGLAQPTVRITLLDKDGKQLADLAVGGRLGYRQIMESGDQAYVVDLTNTDRLTRGIKGLLTKVEQSPPVNDLMGGDKNEAAPTPPARP